MMMIITLRESVKNRVTHLVDDENLNIVACSALGTFEINKYVSFIDYPKLFESQQKNAYWNVSI